MFFCDHDDWLGTEALERLYDFATSCGSDIVLPKMAGLQRLFRASSSGRQSVSAASATSQIMDSLTPHKLFRREFLDKHNIRFPEGQRRLEDHLFVVTSYLLGRRDQHLRRLHLLLPHPAHRHRPTQAFAIPTGRATSTIWRRRSRSSWRTPSREKSATASFGVGSRSKWCSDLVRRRWVKLSDDEAAELFSNAHRIASRYFDEGVVSFCSPSRSAWPVPSLLATQRRCVASQKRSATLGAYPRVLQVGWVDGRLQISGTVQLSDVTPPGRSCPVPPRARHRRRGRGDVRRDA